jgi:rhamnose utilization protein RhaD (predicted bifunctional aldolase and dehydrogenase)
MAFEMTRLYRDSAMADKQAVAMLGHEDGIVTFGRTADEAAEIMVRYLAHALRRLEQL